MKQEIEFLISSDGKIEFTINGIKGKSCEDIEKIFDELGKKLSSKKTKDFYSSEKSTIKTTDRI
ncbi:DUF2997 domain-containing protein [bacterium]|nr:DUF2997 domain-containing protein [bacterium]